MIYAAWQSVVQFVISTLSNDPKLCARYAGIFKSSISLGMTLSFAVTAADVEFLSQLEWQFAQQTISLGILFFLCYFVTETNYYKEGGWAGENMYVCRRRMGTDEFFAGVDDVIVPTYVDEIVHGRVDVESKSVRWN